MVIMNMIVKTSDLVGFEAENQNINKAAKAALSKLLASWETKQANKAKKIGGLGFLAVTLAACNDSSSDLVDTSGVTHATVDAAITSNDAQIANGAETAALTYNGTIYGSSTEIYTAGSTAGAAGVDITTDNAAAVTTALTDASGTSHATVDAAITSNDTAIAAAVDITTDNATATDASVAAQTSFTSLADLVTAYTNLTAAKTASLTTGTTDVITGSPSNDTFTATTTTLQATDVISDTSSTDSDTLNLTLTGNLPATSITNIEAINVTWDAFGTPTLDLVNISGSPVVTMTSSKVGYLGGADIDNIGTKTFTAGSGVNGTIDIDGATATTVNATAGGTVTVDGTATAANNLSATVTGGTTVTVGGAGAANTFITNTVTGDANTTTITVTGGELATQASSITATGGAATTTITGTNAGTISINGSAATTTVTAQHLVAATAAANIAVTGTGLTTVTVDGSASTADTASITTSAAALTANLGVTTALENVTLNVPSSSTTTLNGAAQFTTLTVASDGNVTLVAAQDDLTSKTVVDNAGDITVDFTHGGTAVLTNVDVANLNMKATHASVVTVKNGQIVTIDNSIATLDAGLSFTVAGTGTSDVVTFNMTGDKANDILTTAVETMNVNTTMAAADANSINTLAGITSAGNVNVVANSALTITALEATTNNTTVQAAGNLVITDFTAASLDATGTTGTSSITSDSTASQVVVGGAGTNTVVFAATANNSTYTGTAANDTVTMVNSTGTAVAALGDGTNTVTAAAISSGTVNVTGGSGVDTLTTGAASTTGTIVFNGGGGNDQFNLSDLGGGAETVTFTGGDGNDTVTLANALNAGTYTFNFGDGTGDTLDLTSADTDLSGQTITATGLDIIKIDHATADVVNATLLNNQTMTITGDGGASDLLGVTATTASQTLNFSSITITDSMATGLKGLNITTAGGTNNVTGSGGGDTVTGGAGVDTITSGAGADTVTGGASNDVITLGEGADKVVLNGGTDAVTLTETTAAADTISVDIGGATLTGFDFGGTASDDNVEIDVSQIELATSIAGVKNSGAVVDLMDISGVAMTAEAVTFKTITGASVLGAGSEEILVLNGNVASDSALETALAVGGTFQISNPGAALADNDVILVLYDNGVNSYLATVETAGGIATNGTSTAANLNAATFLTFTGVADCTSILAGDFAATI